MPETPAKSDSAPVTDRRLMPRGVMPRGMQTWLMAGLAGGMILIMFVVGRPDPPARQVPMTAAASAPDPDRVRAYQDQLRAMEARAAQQAQESSVSQQPVQSGFTGDPPAAPTRDPLAEERKRRDYESLFAGNVVLSRRPTTERPDGGQEISAIHTSTPPSQATRTPSIDDIAEAAVRATTRATAAIASPSTGPSTMAPGAPAATPTATNAGPRPPDRTNAIEDAGSMHRILEGTVIDAVLANRLDGGVAAPVNCLVTDAVYSHTGQQVVIPAGARILGETKPVQSFGESRLAVAFHRLVMPDGSTYSLDEPTGLNQRGDAGLHDQVNQHYWSSFGTAAAVGLISGLAQFVGTAGVAGGDGNRTVVIAGGAADAASQASAQTMNRFLNRLPTVTIREGHRVKVYLTKDLELPAYQSAAASRSF
jgi:type IV secretory pathway VirB10-like protein